MVPEQRPIRQAESDVLRAALERARVDDVDESTVTSIATLEIIARCECGCATVHFAHPVTHERARIIADAKGRTPSGTQVGVMVWGRRDAITGLEIYDMGGNPDDLVLPVLASIARW
jgi:hypothetical protein